ncbi:hypothetical protein VCUG_01854 [Vavraia culicis subsp. floridensis]|uniref:Pre-mRNA-splicing factor CWC24 n=1 Tax=Vavraia culicis (isolate floridensis) TaxID=948595 RepID=L2GTJ2_VAVCU|nr:uncharacterized protein VCUG_01854 [Vavraia culicis subsp. floridensis]ELA46628.1 hypothetical protein VCUG_01854 [Vavraia culicis subsp. floridensis]
MKQNKTHKLVCKEFKETGTCRYKDDCKYLHTIDVDDDIICMICRKEYDEKVMADCGHAFCLKCAFDEYQKDDKCYKCKINTYGRFKPLF